MFSYEQAESRGHSYEEPLAAQVSGYVTVQGNANDPWGYFAEKAPHNATSLPLLRGLTLSARLVKLTTSEITNSDSSFR
jgi:hypothetical protein